MKPACCVFDNGGAQTAPTRITDIVLLLLKHARVINNKEPASIPGPPSDRS